MKILLPVLAITSTVLLSSAMAQSVEKKVALKVKTEHPPRYAGTAPNGGLNIKSRTITERQVFVLVDINGGELADGDVVYVKSTAEGTQPSYWSEAEGGLKRVRKTSPSTQFEIKKTADGISFQTPNGKFVSAATAGDPLSLVDAADSATVFEIVEDPAVESGLGEKEEKE